jgi:hypothetical protein
MIRCQIIEILAFTKVLDFINGAGVQGHYQFLMNGSTSHLWVK